MGQFLHIVDRYKNTLGNLYSLPYSLLDVEV